MSARARAAFLVQDDTPLLEWQLRPGTSKCRWLADAHGNVVHRERECSLPAAPEGYRGASVALLGPADLSASRVVPATPPAVDYVGAGTVEPIVRSALTSSFSGDEYPVAGGTPGHRGDSLIDQSSGSCVRVRASKLGFAPKRHRAAARDEARVKARMIPAWNLAHRRPVLAVFEPAGPNNDHHC